MSELVPSESTEITVPSYRFRTDIPREHCSSSDTKLRWLWNQRFGTIQAIWQNATDGDTKAAAALCLNAAYVGDLTSINLLLNRLEGSPMLDEDLLDFSPDPMPI